jgi:hypothetical protein
MTHIFFNQARLLLPAILTAAVLFFAPPAGAALQAVGPVSGPHGFPLYYTDSNNLSLELCLDDGWCAFDPIDPDNDNHVELGVGGEVFWWMAEAIIDEDSPADDDTFVGPLPGPDFDALLVLALEGTFGGDESVVNGQQISFGRLRIRIDVTAPGTYTVTHPYGTEIFNNVTVEDGINFTADIGSANFLDVEKGFQGALQSDIGPFLTWDTFNPDPAANDPALIAGDAHYVGDNATPHRVTGSPTGNNLFRVEGPGGILVETRLFVVMGKVYDGDPATPHVYPDPPPINLTAVGPVNRLAPFVAGSTAQLVTDGTTAGYPLGYPVWYEDENGLRLTICPGSDPRCISDPITSSDPLQVGLGTGGETFWWAADAAIDEDHPDFGDLPVGLDEDGDEVEFDALLVLGIEGTFGGDESIIDGQQISFGRTRIRIDTPVAGDYTVIYPYGMKIFEDVPVDKGGINFTADIGIADLADPDSAFVGALYSEIGPQFLTWPDYLNEPDLNAGGVQYIGDPRFPNPVTGSTFVYDEEEGPVNYFRVIGPEGSGIDIRTELFLVQGKVFDPATFRAAVPATGIVARDDNATAVTARPRVINDVLVNDTFNGGPIPAGSPVTLISPPRFGNVVVSGNNSFTYTSNAGFEGTDTFSYNVLVGQQVSNTATVTVTVIPFQPFNWSMFIPAFQDRGQE